jgi:hypothetical protein
MKYRKRPVEIEAMLWSGSNWHEMLAWVKWDNDAAVFNDHGKLIIPTLEGDMTADEGDWVIRGIAGEFYPCKPDIFEATYEAVEEEE